MDVIADLSSDKIPRFITEGQINEREQKARQKQAEKTWRRVWDHLLRWANKEAKAIANKKG